MKVAILTLCQGSYHLGVAALINSLMTNAGFKGTVYVFYQGDPPPWKNVLSKGQLEEIKVEFRQISPRRSLGFYKPFAALEVLENDPELDGIIFADADVLFLAPWPLFEDWLNSGVALCLDCNFGWLHSNHPWRRKWKELVLRAGLEVVRECSEYPNSGFFGVTRSRSAVLKNWITATLQFEKEGGNTSKFTQEHRNRAIVGDQDLLAAALHTIKDEISYLGEEGMGFNGHFFVLSHAIEKTKPWNKCFSWRALKGEKPSQPAQLWIACSQCPIPAMPPSKYFLSRIDFAIARCISRVWKR
jgi:uncharacterized protein YndB with AHSA1/START domain